MDNISQKIKIFLEKYEINKPDMVYLVAFSGGYDSMCLLWALKNITDNKIVAIHLNHCWRGKESDLEEKNCQNFCKKINVEFYSEKLSEKVPKTETSARDARYEFFKRCSEKYGSNVVFTAHNKNDNAETLIYRICKGTGVSGLQGIAPLRDIFYRPLLDVSRDEIEAFCLEYKLKPNNDSSNKDIKYKRNYIRSKIIPELSNICDNVVESLNSLSDVAKEETQIVEEYVNLTLDKITQDGKIKTKKFLKLSESLQKRIIYNIFINNNIDYDRKKITGIWEFIKSASLLKSGKTCSLTKDLWVFASDKYIEAVNKKNNKSHSSVNILKEGTYNTPDWTFKIEKFTGKIDKYPDDRENTAYVDLSEIPFDYCLRHRKDGDVISPLGASGSQKLKKYLNGKKIPNHEKDNLFFLTKGNEILWAINLGISDKIKTKDKPTHKLTFYERQKNGY